MVILGLDASTTTAGWAINKDGIIVRAGFIDLKKSNTRKDKSFCIIKSLATEPLMSEVTHINIEEALCGFMRGFTSQQTLITLTKFSAVLEYILSTHYKKIVNTIPVNTARKHLFGKTRIDGLSSKEFVKKELLEKYPYIENFHVLNNRGNLDIRNQDLYDACVCAFFDDFTIELHTKKKKKKTSKNKID